MKKLKMERPPGNEVLLESEVFKGPKSWVLRTRYLTGEEWIFDGSDWTRTQEAFDEAE